jgi:hypothetical protein
MRNLRVLFLFLFLGAPWALVHADEWHYSNVDRIVAVGDIHGAYDALVKTLQAADVIDSRLTWSGEKTHLVFTGDLLDRGAKSRQVMDLVMRLEKEARRRGGRVHLLLGNHEVMNLNGDLRYVADAEYAAYQDIESSRERERWFRDFLASQPEDNGLVLRAEFDTLAPPGYFGHRKAFRHNGKYGKWLLGKPFIVVINETAFVHGGLPKFVTEHGLEGVNTGLKNDLQFYVLIRDQLADQKILSPIYRFKQIPALLEEKRDAGQILWKQQEPVQGLIDLSKSPLHTSIGPTWYRGTAMCSALVEGDVLAGAFAKIDASRVVMGHTSTITRQVQQRMDGRTVEIDTGMLKEEYNGSGNALIIEGDKLTVANQDGRSGLSAVEHPMRVGHESIPLDDDGLAIVLSQGNLVELNVEGESRRFVEVTSGDLTVFAHFRESQDESQDNSFAPELAAYRLDRMLGLGMVPVTTRREVDGQPGTLQLVPANSVTDAELAAMKTSVRAPCSLDKQAAAMRVFDALIDNSARTPSAMLYDPEDLLLILVDHGAAFATVGPGHIAHAEITAGKQWRTALRGLDDDALRAELGDVLDEQQLADLKQRRDALMSNLDD